MFQIIVQSKQLQCYIFIVFFVLIASDKITFKNLCLKAIHTL